MASHNLHAYLAGHAPIIEENDANHFNQVRQYQQMYDLELRQKQADYNRFVHLGGNPLEGFDPSGYSDEAAKKEKKRVGELFAAENDAKNYYANELEKHQEREKIMELEKNRKEMIRQRQQEERQRQQEEMQRQQEERQRQQEEMQRQQEEMIRTREKMINQNRKKLPPSTISPGGYLSALGKSILGRPPFGGGRRSSKKAKKGKKGTRRHSKKKGTRRH